MSEKNYIKAFQKHIMLLCIIATLIVPIINNFVLSYVLSAIYGNVMYATEEALLMFFIPALDTLNLFVLYGVLTNSLVRFGGKKSVGVITLCFIRIFIVYASYIAVGSFETKDFANTLSSNLIYCLVNSLIDIMLVVGAIVLCYILRTKHLAVDNTDITIRKMFNLKNPLINCIFAVACLIAVFLVSGCITTTVTDIATYGASNLNASEVIYLITPYLKWLFKIVFGYFVMIYVAKWLDFQWKTLHETTPNKKKK